MDTACCAGQRFSLRKESMHLYRKGKLRGYSGQSKDKSYIHSLGEVEGRWKMWEFMALTLWLTVSCLVVTVLGAILLRRIPKDVLERP